MVNNMHSPYANRLEGRLYPGHRFGMCCLAMIALLLVQPALAEVRAHLDRSKVFIGDPVTLVIESTGSSSGDPDLSPLNKDFRVLGTGTSSQFSFSNGRSSNRTTWTVQLGPLQTGTLRIPPIQVGNEKTRALELEVTDVPDQAATGSSEHLFLEAQLEAGGNIYVQQQISYTLRFFHDDSLLSGELSPPPLRDALMRQIGDEARYTVTRNNRRYQVVERRYVISPEKSGELRIPPASFSGRVSAGQPPRAQSRRDRLMQDFFRGSPFGGNGKSVRVFSKPVTVDVKPRPAGFSGAWLPAEDLQLHDSWTDDPPELRAGEPVSRTLSVRATGLAGEQIPSLKLDQPPGTRMYPDSPAIETRTANGKVYGLSRQTFTYIPGRAGALTVPTVEVPWWNTGDDTQAFARLPEWVLNVAPGAAGTAPSPQSQNRQTSTPSVSDGAEVRAREGERTSASWPNSWAWLAIALVVSVILTIVFLAFRRRTVPVRRPDSAVPEKPVAADQRAPDVGELLPTLQQACESDDATGAAQALLALAQAHWPEDPPRSLGQLAARLGDAGDQVRTLDRVLYAADSGVWHGAGLWAAVKDAWRGRAERPKPTPDVLQPLYPQQD